MFHPLTPKAGELGGTWKLKKLLPALGQSFTRSPARGKLTVFSPPLSSLWWEGQELAYRQPFRDGEGRGLARAGS